MKTEIIEQILRESKWIGKKSNFDISKELVDIKSTNLEFVDNLKILLNQKFSEIGKQLKQLLKPASKGKRKDLLIFVPDAARKIYQINDEFTQYIIRSIYDNYNDITNGIIFRMHMNELFASDFITNLTKELNVKIKDLFDKKEQVRTEFKERWSVLCDENEKYSYSKYSRRLSDNVFNLPISKPFYETIREFKAKVKKEHPRVPDDKVWKYIDNDYSYRQERDKIVEEFLNTIPERVDLEKRIAKHFEDERVQTKAISDAIEKEIKELEFDKMKPIIRKMIDQFIAVISYKIVKGDL